MAFPTAPVNGQSYTATSGMVYIYNAAKLAWFVNYQPISLDNVLATTPPTGTDDETKGYVVGSTWYDSAADELYINTSKTAGTATWKLIDKKTVSGTTLPTVNSDITVGFSKGSLWYHTPSKSTYTCMDATASTAVWIKTSFQAAYAYGQLPLLTTIPAITAPIVPLTPPTLMDITYLTGVYTITTPGTYRISYVANFEASTLKKGYFTSVVVNGISDPIQGLSQTYRDVSNTHHSNIISLEKTKLLAADATITINHFTDNHAATVSGDFSIVRID